MKGKYPKQDDDGLGSPLLPTPKPLQTVTASPMHSKLCLPTPLSTSSPCPQVGVGSAANHHHPPLPAVTVPQPFSRL